jgi:signal transduction histidine kinase
VQVEDDGRGISDDAATRGTGFGLIGMRERAELAGGELDVRPGRTRGTRVTLTIPAE